MRKVGAESRKTWLDKDSNGFFGKYMIGKGLDIGYKGYETDILPILADAVGLDLDTPGYDGTTIPEKDNKFSYVYSSHTLEHVSDYKNFIRECYRVTKIGGHVIIVVPHQWIYEKKANLPSKWNPDHKRFYTSSSLCKEIENSLLINSFRIRHLRENDEGHDYSSGPDVHGQWNYEIEVVIQKLP